MMVHILFMRNLEDMKIDIEDYQKEAAIENYKDRKINTGIK